jgi:hypothetical protein
LLVALICPIVPATGDQVDIGTAYTSEQRHAAAELGYALGVQLNMYENPPVCMRMRPNGAIIAEVFGREELQRIRRALRELNLKATTRVTSIAAYNASIRRLARTVTAEKPARFIDVRVGFRQIETLSRPNGDLDFEPQCPPVSVLRPTLHSKSGLPAEEDAWAEAAERRYGGDRVEWRCCDARIKGPIKITPDSFSAWQAAASGSSSSWRLSGSPHSARASP